MLTCRYGCGEVAGRPGTHYHSCPRAPWRTQHGWQAVALVATPWWRRLLGR